MNKTLYEVLGVENTATQAEIKKAYWALAKEHHPDIGGDPKIMAEISHAYDILSNDKKKDRYDTTGNTALEVAFMPKFIALASDLFIRMINECDEEDLKTLDLIEGMKKNIKKLIDQLTESQCKLIDKENKFLLAKKRLKTKGDNVLLRVLDDEIKSVKLGIEAHGEEIIFMQEANEVLAEYNYDIDKMQQIGSGSFLFGTQTQFT